MSEYKGSGHGHLRFDSSVLSKLGEELIPKFDQGITELVRNAYDADADLCTVELIGIDDVGGTILVTDDGLGMDRKQLEDGWLVIGRSGKKGKTQTQTKKRAPVGDKGLGRLAALRLGSRAVMFSVPASEGMFPNVYGALINWNRYLEKSVVEDVSFPIKTVNLGKPVNHGTQIRIRNISRKLSSTEIKNLARSLALLANPFDDISDFRVKLIAPGYSDLENVVSKGYLDDAEFRVFSQIDDQGNPHACVYDWKGDVIWTADPKELLGGEKAKIYYAPSTTFELWMYTLNKSAFTKRSSNVGEVRDWLSTVGGVHFYYRGFRVHPYGDSGHDWLEMNLSRVRSPELRPSTNTSIGRVMVDDPEGLLKQKTDRLGFIEEDLAFTEIKRFSQNVLNWVSKKRIELRDLQKESVSRASHRKLTEGARKVKNIVRDNRMPDDLRDEVRSAFQLITHATKSQKSVLEEDLKLYRALATAGATAAVFSHEVGKPLSDIPGRLKSIEQLVQSDGGTEKVAERIRWISDYLKRVGSFAKLQLALLSRDKRRVTTIPVDNVIGEVINYFDLLLFDTSSNIKIKLNLNSNSAEIKGSVSLIESIIVNCVTNSVNALRSKGYPMDERVIEIETLSSSERLQLIISDNGPGIKDVSKDEIWLPGVTTSKDGTGFGLTIIKDSVNDLGGTYGVEEQGKLGGASFFFSFPLSKNE